MWVVVVYPPLAIPWGLPRPDRCPCCGAERALAVHGHVRRRLPYVKARPNSAGELPVSELRTVRVRCAECGVTILLRWPLPDGSTRVPRLVAAKAVAWYALGDRPGAITAALGYSGTPVSRRTLYRVLADVGDPKLQELHRLNRRLRRASARRQPIRFFQGADIPALVEDFAEAVARPATLVDRHIGYGPGVIAVRWVAVVFKVYASAAVRSTLDWIDAYLRRMGAAGVLRFPTRERLDAVFRPDVPVPYNSPADDLVLPMAVLEAPLDVGLRPVRNAVATALRMVDFGEPMINESLDWGIEWAGRGRRFRVGDVDLADLHEGAPSRREHPRVGASRS